jgi:RNA polymerase sigma factor (sigma-70 family)
MTSGTRGSLLRSIQTLFGVGSVGGMTDGQLLEQFLARRDEGAEAAFAALVALHGPMVWDVCRGVLSDAHMAEDAFQATFLILVRKAGSIRRREAVGPWLHGVARRVAARAKAAAARRRRREGQCSEMKMTPIPDPIRREQLMALHEEVDRLPEKYRAPVVLCHLEGRTHAEAARLLRCPVGTVSIRLSRARERLRARLSRRGLALPAALAGTMLGSGTASAAMPTGLAEPTIKAAMRLAAGKAMTAAAIPTSVAQLVEGEIRTMIFTRLMMAAEGVLAAGLVTVGVGLLAAGERPAQINPGVAPVTAAPAQADGDDREARVRSMNNFKLMGLAMNSFAVANDGRFPPAAIRKDGKPLLSWRVALLPFLEQKALYERFHLDEPWDSPHNKALLKEMPAVYAPVARKDPEQNSTYYQVFVGPGTLFDGDEGTRRADIKDKLAFTIMVVEAAEPVPWTKPEDLAYDEAQPLPRLGGQFKGGYHVALADGAALFLSKEVAPETLRALITRSGGEVISIDKLRPGEPGPLHQLMEDVNAKSNAIKKTIRNSVAYKKAQAQKEIVTTTGVLIKLSKEARGLSKEGIKNAKDVEDAERRWFELIDALTSQLEEFAQAAGQVDTTHGAAKSAWNQVNRKCTDCHTVFRVEVED